MHIACVRRRLEACSSECVALYYYCYYAYSGAAHLEVDYLTVSASCPRLSTATRVAMLPSRCENAD